MNIKHSDVHPLKPTATTTTAPTTPTPTTPTPTTPAPKKKKASFGWTFIAKGIYQTIDEDHFYKDGATLGECIEYCQQYREKYGKDWNGLVFRESDGMCGCQKNSHGINSEGWSEWVLYRVA